MGFEVELSLIVVVSDLHIGGSEAPFFNKRGFNQFVQSFLKERESEISHFIMLGDVVDLWWKPTSEVVQESSETLLELSRLDMKKYYLIGNHDFEFKTIYPLEIEFEIIEGISSTKSSKGNGIVHDESLRNGGKEFRFIHGHQIAYWYALSFYELFCKAMCGRMDTIPVSNVWNTILEREGASEKVRFGIQNLSSEIRGKLEYYLAGPLEPSLEDERKSVLEEWELLRRFENFTRILELLSDDDILQELKEELEKVTSKIGIQFSKASSDSRIHMLEMYSKVWRDVLRRIDLIAEGKIPLESTEDVILKSRRLAAKLSTGLRSDEFLIHGHSHQAYLSKTYMSGDPGHWLGNAGSYLVIDDGKIDLENWVTK